MIALSRIAGVRRARLTLAIVAALSLGFGVAACTDLPKKESSEQTDASKPQAGAPAEPESTGSDGAIDDVTSEPGIADDRAFEQKRQERARQAEADRARMEEMRRRDAEDRANQAQTKDEGAREPERSRSAAPKASRGPAGGAAPPGAKAPAPDQDFGAAPAPEPPPPPPPAMDRAETPPSGGAAPPDTGAPAPPMAAADANKPFDIVPVFFGTDRNIVVDPQRVKFGSERAHKLSLGRAMITVPSDHKVPHIERPWVVEIPYFKLKIYEEKEDPAKHFTVQEIAALTKEQMLAYVRKRLEVSTRFKDHALVFVHGFNTSFDNALYRTAQITYDLKFDGAPFLYSWPSGGKVASYTYDRGSAEQAEPHLAEFLDLVVKESGAKSISLIAHSMGNELLMRVLERTRPVVPDGVVISQVILAAPDVDRDKFRNIAKQITSFSQGVTLYAASNDRALGYSARFWGGVPRAGDVPATGPLIVTGVDTIDVTAVSTDSLGLNHSGYAENKALLNDIGLLLQTGERPPEKRVPILQRIDSADGAFWRYPLPP